MSRSSPENLPLHMQYPGNQELAGEFDPERFLDFFDWLADDQLRLKSATEYMQRNPVGFNAVTISVKHDEETGAVDEIVQLNFYDPDSPPQEYPHRHPRDADATLYGWPGTRQVIRRWAVLDNDMPPEMVHFEQTEPDENFDKTWRRMDELDEVATRLRRCAAVANVIVDLGDGRRPDYYPIDLGKATLLEMSTTHVAPGTNTKFMSLEVHDVAMKFGEDENIAVSVHRKVLEEPAAYNTIGGLRFFKGLTWRQANSVIREVDMIREEFLTAGERIAPIAMMYPPIGFKPSDIESTAVPTGAEKAEDLIWRAYQMAKYVVKSQVEI